MILMAWMMLSRILSHQYMRPNGTLFILIRKLTLSEQKFPLNLLRELHPTKIITKKKLPNQSLSLLRRHPSLPYPWLSPRAKSTQFRNTSRGSTP